MSKTRSTPIERTIYINGENGIVRLPPRIWKAFYEAAIYLEIASVQDAFIAYLVSGGIITKHIDFVIVVEQLERNPHAIEGLNDFGASRHSL